MTAQAYVAPTIRRGLQFALLLLAVTSVPYAYAALTTPPDMVYTGLMFNVADHSQYWSWVTASRRSLFITNTMTPEPNPPVFMNGMMWALAQIQRALGLSFPALFQFWRVLGVGVLVPALWLLSRTLVAEEERRRTAVLIMVLGAGLGWMLVVLKKLTGSTDVLWPLDIYIVETNTFWTLLVYPYYAFAEGLLVLALLSVWWAHKTGSYVGCVCAAFGAFLLAFFHAYDLIILYSVVGAFGLAIWARTRRFPRMLFVTGVVVMLASAPLAFYYFYLTSSDPLWRSVLAQYPNAGVWTPSPPHLLILIGVPLLLALVGLSVGWPRDDAEAFVVTWTIVGAVLIYIPTVYQVKMLAGWQLPLAILAARGWHGRVLPALRRLMLLRWHVAPRLANSSSLAAAFLVALIVPTNVYLFAWRFVDLGRHSTPYYLHRDELRALEWLANNSIQNDVVLAPLDVGRFVPSYGETRSYLAHWAMTNRYFERVDNVAMFFAHGTSDKWRTRLMSDENVTLVLRAAPTTNPSVFDPGQSPLLFEPVLVLPRAQVYRLRKAEVSHSSQHAERGGP